MAKLQTLSILYRTVLKRAGGRTNGLALAATLTTIMLILAHENQKIANIVALCVFGFFFSLALLFTRRPALSALLGSAVIAAIFMASKIKFHFMSSTLHVLDIVYFLDIRTIQFGINAYFWYLLPAALFPILLAAIFKYGRKQTAVPLRMAVIPLLATLSIFASVSAFSQGLHNRGRPSMVYFRDRFHISSLGFSSLDFAEQFFRHQSAFQYGPALIDVPAQLAQRESGCVLGARPDVIIVLRESAFPLSKFRQTAAAQTGPEPYQSSDGVTRTLRVETHGGGTWLTMFSVLSGISAQGFGPLRNYVNALVEGRISEAMPHLFKSCGYETLATSSADFGFANLAGFFKSLGFDAYLSGRDVRNLSSAPKPDAWKNWEPDRFYYDFLLHKIAALPADKPFFGLIETLATHAPYNFVAHPDVTPRNTAYSAIGDPELAEYVRRSLVANDDYSDFKEQLKRSGRPTLIVHFGDHHPYLTKHFLGKRDVIDRDDPETARLFETYVAIDWVNFAPAKPISHFANLDVPFVPSLILQALDAQPQGTWKLREQFMTECAGQYWNCKGGEAAHRLHQALQKSQAIRF